MIVRFFENKSTLSFIEIFRSRRFSLSSSVRYLFALPNVSFLIFSVHFVLLRLYFCSLRISLVAHFINLFLLCLFTFLSHQSF